jgi:transcriptional regulator NrdR family protein
MTCPECGREGTDKTVETRDKGNVIRRRRACLKCGHRWSTEEMRIESLVYMTCADEAKAVLAGDDRRLVLITEPPSGGTTT